MNLDRFNTLISGIALLSVIVFVSVVGCKQHSKPLVLQENMRLIYLPRLSYTPEELDSIVKSYGFASLSYLDSINYVIEDTIRIHDTIRIYKNKVTNIGTARDVIIGQ